METPANVSELSEDAVPETRAAGPRIVSLCCLYPNLLQPRQGLFVQRRLQHIAELTDVLVVAPFALVQYGDQSGNRLRLGARSFWRMDGDVAVCHPRWFYTPLTGAVTPFWLFVRILPLLARMRAKFPFDVIDTHFGYPEGIAGALAAVALRLPFTMTLRGNEPKHSAGRASRFLMRWALRRAAVVFTVSERLRGFAVELGAGPENVIVVPNGVDAALFHPRDRVACRRKHGFALDRPLIVSAGALVERKGHHRVVRALAGMDPRDRPQLAIVGGSGPEGGFHNELRRIVASCALEPHVRFLGPLPPEGVAEVMSAADVFCLASSNEGWPNVVHEAMACGAPVVATDVGAIPEMLGDGARGLVVPVDDPAALRTGLESALRRRWDRQAIAAWAQARSWGQVAREVVDSMRERIMDRGARVRR